MELDVSKGPSLSRPLPNLAGSIRARGPETGDPEMEGAALREMATAPLLPPEEGRVENFKILNQVVSFYFCYAQIFKERGMERLNEHD